MVKIYKVKIRNRKTGKIETRYRVGTKARKFSPLYYTKQAAQNARRRFG